MKSIVINPGAGEIANATKENADRNMRKFVSDIRYEGVDQATYTYLDREHRGRWAYGLQIDDRVFEIEMPGLPISQVRFLDSPSQDIWRFSRLYVNESSWLWLFAIKIVLEATGECFDCEVDLLHLITGIDGRDRCKDCNYGYATPQEV